MNLAIDIGNTNTRIALFSFNRIIRRFTKKTNSSFNKEISVLSKYEIKHTGISSVVPSVTEKWGNLCLRNFKSDVLIISNKTKLPLKLKLNNTDTLGPDRICNAVFGYNYFNKRQNVIIVSLGTANTFDVVLSNGDYIGGMISPGFSLMYDALHKGTSLLPKVSHVKLNKAVRLIGKDTVSAIHSGVIHSVLFTIREFIRNTEKTFGRKFKVILTGGNSFMLREKPWSKIYLLPDSVLHGINIILNYNIINENTDN